jgi:GTP-binding protein
MLACDLPGTTRDSVAAPFERDGQRYVLIDTAGVRRRARVSEIVEKFSVIKTLQAIQQSHVTVLVLDARQGISDQDASLLG